MASYQQLKGNRDLKVYQLAYKLAMEIFQMSKAFPKKKNIHSPAKFADLQEALPHYKLRETLKQHNRA